MASSFRLATFNLENLDWTPARALEFERRTKALRPIFRDLAADVICLQEVDAQKDASHGPRRFLALDRLLSGTKYENYFRATSLRPGTESPADVHNLVILSRWPIEEQLQLFHDIVPKWSWTPPVEGHAGASPIEVSWDRPLLYSRVILPNGGRLHLVNLHLRAPRAVPVPEAKETRKLHSSRSWAEGQFLAAQKREGQALEARLFVERLFDRETKPLVAVCGDLNADEYDAPTRLIRGVPDEDEGGPHPRALLSLEERVEEERRFTVIHAGRPILLDHILASRRLSAVCVDLTILNEGLQDEATAQDPIIGSLHAPVVAGFDLASN